MKRSAPLNTILFSLSLAVFVFYNNLLFAQSQSGCTVTFPNNFDNQVDFSAIYNPALCPSGDVILANLNDKNGNSTVTFDASVTLNSLTLNYKSGNNPLEIIIPSGVTLNITNDLIMNLSSAVQDKFLTVEGTLTVGGTLDFGGINMEIDGTGTINATTITGGDATTCSTTGGGTGTCPTINAVACNDPSGLCAETGTVTLPIELIYFAGQENEDLVQLSWSTASEENFNYFEVQRAFEGTNFETIGEVAGAGNSYTRKDYSFEDRFPELGYNYYRLKSVDLDGTFEYSNVALVKFSSGAELHISPNPSTGLVYIKSNIPDSGIMEFSITNQSGNMVYSGSLSGFNTSVDLNHLVKGIYIIRLTNFPSIPPQRLVLR